MRKPRAGIVVAVVLTGVMALFCGVAMVVVRSVAASTLASDGTLKAGEFAITPLAVEEQRAIGSETAPVGRSFYIVRVQLANNAATASFHFDPHQMLVKALDTGKAVRSRRGQQALGSDGMADVGARTTVTDEVVFAGPAGIHRMNIRFNLLGGPGEFVAGVFGGSPTVELAVNQTPPPEVDKTKIDKTRKAINK